jgi:hypothetical protein
MPIDLNFDEVRRDFCFIGGRKTDLDFSLFSIIRLCSSYFFACSINLNR